MRPNEFTASPAALDRARLRMTFTAPQLSLDRALADGIPAQRLREVANANKRTAAGRRTSAADAVRLENQAAGLLSVATRLVAANDNGRVRRAVA